MVYSVKLFAALVWLAFCIANVGAYFTSIIANIVAANYLLLLACGVIPPIGVVWGWGHWFGAW